MRARRLPFVVLALLLAGASGLALWAPSALAQPAGGEPSAAQKRDAGAAFDRGLARFRAGEFAEAARDFLAADRLVPSSQAITNAIAAARKANDHLLVAQAAQRAIARGDADAPSARAALAEAETRLARLELRCELPGCAIQIDGGPVKESVAFVLPGDHHLEGKGTAGAADEERIHCVAGATYQVVLRAAPGVAPRPSSAPALPPSVSPPPPSASAPPPPVPSRGLPKAVFFVGAGATAVLGGLTIWSGLDAIQAKKALPPVPQQEQNDAVLARARRSDFLLLGTGLAAVGTAIVGVAFTAWDSAPASAFLAPTPGGALLGARGSF